MSPLTLERDIFLPGHFGVWGWSEADWNEPLVFPTSKGSTYLRLEKPYGFDSVVKRQTPFSGTFGVQFDAPSKAIIKAVKSQNDRSVTFAEEVFTHFESTMLRAESILRTTAGLKELFWHGHESFSDFFLNSTYKVTWSHGEDSGDFAPKIKISRRRYADSFRRKNLIDRDTWSKLQKSINDENFPSEAVLELLRIRSRVAFRDRALPMIEAAIVTERTVRDFVLLKLKDQGMASKRIKELKNDLTFSLNSNVFLPLCLTKTEIKKLTKHIWGVNKLRKLRNDVAHSNIGYDDVTYEDAKVAVESAIALVKFVEQKL